MNNKITLEFDATELALLYYAICQYKNPPRNHVEIKKQLVNRLFDAVKELNGK